MEAICAPGVDPDFDLLISALGHIARQKPKPLLDTLMYWRKAKGELAQKARESANPVAVRNILELEPLLNRVLG